MLELQVSNTTDAHHPFHLHGFSFQPVSLAPGPGAASGSPTFSWGHNEFVDTLDIPNDYILTFRVRLEANRRLADETTVGGSLGRWLFHCHIFFHAHRGMLSELVVTDADGSGNEKPNIDVGGSWTYAPTGGQATRAGTWFIPDGDTLTNIVAHTQSGVQIGDVAVGTNTWSWVSHTAPDPALPDQTTYVFVTISTASGRQDQTVFRLNIGAPDDGADNGDPHIHTVGGQRYDFQAVGEFIALRDREGMEVQTRQAPVPSANPITDAHSGLRTCVSINTAVAARVGPHRIAYQPAGDDSRLQLYVDGKPTRLPDAGLDLGAHRLVPFDADGSVGLRINYAHHTVVTITPRFWSSNQVWYVNVSVDHTQADEGLMAGFAPGSWLPRLSSGRSLGPKPKTLPERFDALYRVFADSWRVTNNNSLFVYAEGTSTETFTDRQWPAERPPCKVKPNLAFPVTPELVSIPEEEARQICSIVTDDGLHQDCVFDVATTGDPSFAQTYRLLQDQRELDTSLELVGERKETWPGELLRVTATVRARRAGRAVPTGSVQFIRNGNPVGAPIAVDDNGVASALLDELEPGQHRIRAEFSPDGTTPAYRESGSANLLHSVVEPSLDPGTPLRLRVVLERIEIRDDRDLFSEGELVFEARVQADDGSPARTRLPATGHWRASDEPGKNVIVVEQEVFRGEAGKALVVQLDGVELDWINADDPLGTYTRRFGGSPAGWLGRHRAGDETLDGEDTGLWRLTYRVQRV